MDSTNKTFNEPLSSPTPGQKLYILSSQLKGLIESIRLDAMLIKKNIESSNITPETLLKDITRIAEVADKIRELPDQVIHSKSSVSDTARESVKITTLDIFLYLRKRLLDAREPSDVEKLVEIQAICEFLLYLVYSKQTPGLGSILEEFESSARDSIMGVPWKSNIPSEEEIKLVLDYEEPH